VFIGSSLAGTDVTDMTRFLLGPGFKGGNPGSSSLEQTSKASVIIARDCFQYPRSDREGLRPAGASELFPDKISWVGASSAPMPLHY
jgi:hypothetical protein